MQEHEQPGRLERLVDFILSLERAALRLEHSAVLNLLSRAALVSAIASNAKKAQAVFAARVRDFCAELDGKSDWFDRTEYTSLDVAHVWYRNVPAGRDAPGCYIMHKCDGPGRGVYPVTEIDVQVACELRQYRAALTA